MSRTELASIPSSADQISFSITGETENNDVVEISYTKGKEAEVRHLMAATKPGAIVTVESIRIMEHGKEKKLPALLYKIK